MSGRKHFIDEKGNSFDPEETTKWTLLIYNKQEGTVLGRNMESWGKNVKICTRIYIK